MLVGFASGVLVAGAVFAFITAVGVVPRLAQKTGTHKNVRIYEIFVGLGGIFGTILGFAKIHVPVGTPFVILISVCIGIFLGCLAMSLAEVLNVIPIFTRRARIQQGMFFIVLAIALGKLIGSLMYFIIPGFFDAGSM